MVLAGTDGVLRHARDPVLGVRHVDAVPVQGDAVRDVLVVQTHLDEVADGRLDQRAGGGAVEGVALHGAAGRERDLALACRQLDHHVGGPLDRPAEVVDRDGVGVPGGTVAGRVGVGVLAPGPAAVVVDAHVHHRVGAGQAAVPPQPPERSEHRDRQGETDPEPDPLLARHRETATSGAAVAAAGTAFAARPA